jgi:hypothetical protein
MARVIVSDHAVLRYLERVLGIDVELVRASITHDVAAALEAGASSVTIEGIRFELNPVARVVKTVWAGGRARGEGRR